MNKRLKSKLYRLVRYEFWPWWAFFIPLAPMYLLTAVVCRRLVYFTAVNPRIDMGGFFGEHKMDIMQLLPKEVTPKECLVELPENALHKMEENHLSFPCFVKPDVGERGWQVKEIHNKEELEEYAAQGFDFLIQEKLNHKMEFGLSFSKLDGQRTRISSLCLKEFMTVVGDGTSTVESLVERHPRHFIYLDMLKEEHPEVLPSIPAKGEHFQVHNIGNHCKGTRFINANYAINEAMEESIHRIVADMDGVDYGRLDLKTESIQALTDGKLKVFEMNGVSGEPGHMYDRPNILWAYGDLYRQWWSILKISRQNIKKGVKTTPLTKFMNQVSNHFLT